MKLLHFFSVLISLLSLATVLSAQEIRTNEKGEKIIVYPDGSWKYFDPNPTSDPFGESQQETHHGETIPTDPKERQAYEDKKSRKKATQVADHAIGRADQLQKQYELAKQRRIALEETLQNMKSLGNAADKTKIQQIQKNWKKAIKAEKNAFKDWKKAKKMAYYAKQMIDAPFKKREKWLAKVDYSSYNFSDSKDEQFTRLDFGPPENYARYNAKQDPLVTPPPYACHILRDQLDAFSGERRRDMQMEELFSFTPVPLRKYMRGRTFIRCSASISAISGGLAYLTLNFHIASPNAQKAFGGIPPGNFILLQTLDGTQIRLRNTVNDPGSYRASDGSYTFRAQCTISAGQQALLKKAEIDRMRVFWQAGYEDYEIYRVNFFKNQLNCLYP